MSKDMTVPCEDGFINIRVGAIIMKEGKFLMVGNRDRSGYLYSVGGRLRFGETAEEAVVREVYEETGVSMQVARLGFVHENYFYGDSRNNSGKLVYEISFFYYMNVPDDFEPASMRFTDGKQEAFLYWIAPDDPVKYYPDFFREELKHPACEVKHFLSDERSF